MKRNEKMETYVFGQILGVAGFRPETASVESPEEDVGMSHGGLRFYISLPFKRLYIDQ